MNYLTDEKKFMKKIGLKINTKDRKGCTFDQAYVILDVNLAEIICCPIKKLILPCSDLREHIVNLDKSDIDIDIASQLIVHDFILEKNYNPKKEKLCETETEFIKSILKARQEYIDLVADFETDKVWLRLLFTHPHNFESRIDVTFKKSPPDIREITRLHNAVRQTYFDEVAKGGTTVIDVNKKIFVDETNKNFLKMYLQDDFGNTYSLSDLSLQELIHTPMVFSSDDSVNLTNFLLMIYCYYRYPIRMKRLSETSFQKIKTGDVWASPVFCVVLYRPKNILIIIIKNI